MNRIPILICDDHAFMRVGLKSMIDMEPDMTVVGEASNGIAAVELARSLSPAVVIMDLMMPELNGVEASRRILAERPDTKIIVITSFGTSNLVNEALDLGVAGVHLKESPTDGLIDAIHKVMSGCQAIDSKMDACDESPIPELTDKQKEILTSVIRGLTNHDIAKQFGISEGGVKKHLRLIFAKIGSANRTEAVAIALRKQLLKI